MMKHIINMDFGANKTPIKVIKEGTFGETYCRDIYSVVNGTEIHGKNLMSWERLIKSIIAQIITMLVFINIVLNVEHHQDFGKMKVGLILWIDMVSYSGILDTGQAEDFQTIKEKLIDGKAL